MTHRAGFANASPIFRPSADVLAVCDSARGSTAETLEAADRHRGTSTVVARTNDSESQLARLSERLLRT